MGPGAKDEAAVTGILVGVIRIAWVLIPRLRDDRSNAKRFFFISLDNFL